VRGGTARRGGWWGHVRNRDPPPDPGAERAAAIAACTLAKVEPAYEMLNGHDPEAFIWSSNAKRRQMTKGQIAMVAAMGLTTAAVARPRGGIDAGKAKAARAAGVSPQRLSTALTVQGTRHQPRRGGDRRNAVPGETVQEVGVLWDRPVVVAGSSG
jgi:hypothetical protein